MADIRCGRVSDSEASAGCERSSREARRRRIEIRRFKFVAVDGVEGALKRQKMDVNSSSPTTSFAWDCENALDSCVSEDSEGNIGKSNKLAKEVTIYQSSLVAVKALGRSASTNLLNIDVIPRFGVASVCGRRRDMEDAVAVHPSFFQQENGSVSGIHYFAVYDGHGCSHVAMKCRDRLHLLVKEELLTEAEGTPEWKETLERSFNRMDEEVVACNEGVLGNCRCELQTPECDAVGSTAVIAIVTPQTIIVANCGDSRAVLCRNGKAVPLSTDHKPDRPDELNRIQEAGGRVIYWDGPRVLGVLAMSRAIGDNYLKPYVSSEPEVTITDRTADDDCLILASDGLWDVVSNDTACGVSRMCLRGKPPLTTSSEMDTTTTTTELGATTADGIVGNKACSDASMLLTKLALARQTTDNVSVVVIDLRKNT